MNWSAEMGRLIERSRFQRDQGACASSPAMLLLVTCIAMIIGRGAQGAVITPTSALATSSWFEPISPARLIDGSGLSGVGDILLQTHDNAGDASTMWHGGPNDAGLGGPTGNPPTVADQAVVFVLPGPTTLTKAYIWNLNQFFSVAERGTKDFEISVSSGADPLTATYTSLGTFTLAAAGGTAAEPAQTVTLASAASNVNLVRFDIISAQSGAAAEYVGLAEVRFEGVPEPASGAIALAGAAVVAVSSRRGKRRHVIA
jgi:hypothetical protein